MILVSSVRNTVTISDGCCRHRMDFESINKTEDAAVVLALTTSNLHRPYGFGRNGTVFGVAPPRNEEHWLVVAPPNPAPFPSEI